MLCKLFIATLTFSVFYLAVCASDQLNSDGQRPNNLKKKDMNPGRSVKLYSYELEMMTSDPSSGSSSSFTITVFWNNEVYQSTMYDPPSSGSQIFMAFESFIYNDYNYFDAPGTKAKMLIQNTGNDDAAIFTSMKLTLEDGTYYQINSFCADPVVLGSYYANFETGSDSECPTGQKQYEAVCIDGNPGLACNPSNVLVYFDKRNPNTISYSAPLSDATGKVMEGCEMLVNPSMAGRCASLTKEECDGARKCNLVIKTFGTEFKSYEEKGLGVINDANGINKYVHNVSIEHFLYIILLMSASVNIGYCCVALKRRVK
eukprot:212432_1